MPFGLEIYRADGVTRLIDAASLGGTFVAVIKQGPGTTQTHTFPLVPAGDLRVIQAVPGNHSWVVGASGASATLTITAFSQLGFASLFVVLARRVIDPAFGIMVTNGAEQACNAVYPQPVFAGVGSINSTPFQTDFLPDGYTLAYHAVTLPGDAGKSKLAFLVLPSSSANTFYSMAPAVGAGASATQRYYRDGVNPPTNATLMVFTKETTYQIPRVLSFEVGPVATSGDTYGLRVFDAGGTVVFDAGVDHIYYSRVTNNFAYPMGAAVAVSNGGLGATPAVSAPEFDFTDVLSFPVGDGTYVHKVTSFRGAMRRNAGAIETVKIEYASRNVVNNSSGLVAGGWGQPSGLVACEVDYSRFGGSAFAFVTVASPSNGGGSGSLPDFSGESVYEEGTALLRFNADGTIDVPNSATFSPNWFAPTTPSVGAGYWLRATRLSGNTTGFSGTLGTWLSLAAAREFSYTTTTTTRSGVFLFEFSSSATGSPIVRQCTNVSITAATIL